MTRRNGQGQANIVKKFMIYDGCRIYAVLYDEVKMTSLTQLGQAGSSTKSIKLNLTSVVNWRFRLHNVCIFVAF